jgi:hypothetical protein
MSATGVNAEGTAHWDLQLLSQQECKEVQSKAFATRSFWEPRCLSVLLFILSPSVHPCDHGLCPQDAEGLSACHWEQKRKKKKDCRSWHCSVDGCGDRVGGRDRIVGKYWLNLRGPTTHVSQTNGGWAYSSLL